MRLFERHFVILAPVFNYLPSHWLSTISQIKATNYYISPCNPSFTFILLSTMQSLQYIYSFTFYHFLFMHLKMLSHCFCFWVRFVIMKCFFEIQRFNLIYHLFLEPDAELQKISSHPILVLLLEFVPIPYSTSPITPTIMHHIIA